VPILNWNLTNNALVFLITKIEFYLKVYLLHIGGTTFKLSISLFPKPI